MATAQLKSKTTAQSNTRQDIETLKSDIQTLSDDVKSLFNNLGQTAKAETHRGVERGKDYVENAADSLTETRTYVEGRVRKNPLAAIGIAMGAGALIAAIARK